MHYQLALITSSIYSFITQTINSLCLVQLFGLIDPLGEQIDRVFEFGNSRLKFDGANATHQRAGARIVIHRSFDGLRMIAKRAIEHGGNLRALLRDDTLLGLALACR
jgi:hypothetical protein